MDPRTVTVRRRVSLFGVEKPGASAEGWSMEGPKAVVGTVGVGASGGAGGDLVGDLVTLVPP